MSVLPNPSITAMSSEQQQRLASFIKQVHELAQIWPGGCLITILPPHASTDHAPDEEGGQKEYEVEHTFYQGEILGEPEDVERPCPEDPRC